MILYHGTSTIHLESIKNEGFRIGSWFALKRWHGFKLAERTSNRDGGESIILEIMIEPYACERFEGRDNPSFKYVGGRYIISKYLKMCYTVPG